MRIAGGRTSTAAAVGAACAMLLIFAGPASAATTTYPNGGSPFAAGTEGWSSSEASCNLELLCTSEASYDASSGDPAGSIVAQTTVTLNLISLFKGTVVWNSPQFTVPVEAITGAEVHLSRAFSPGTLVAVGPKATYTVTLEDLTAKTSTAVLSGELGEGEEAFSPAGSATSVLGGHAYRLSIKTEISQGTLALSTLEGTAAVHFDNIGLAVTSSASASGPGTSSDGSATSNSSTRLTNRTLLAMLRAGAVSGPATLRGKRLFVKVNCPARIGRTCRIVAQGMLGRHRAATRKRVVKVGKGKGRQIVLRVKPKARKKLAKRKRILVREVVHAGKAHATIWKQRKLIRRR